MDQDQEFWFGHTQREKREEREERRERKWRREKRRERRQILVCVTKPKFLVLVHTRFSHMATVEAAKEALWLTGLVRVLDGDVLSKSLRVLDV